MLKNISKRDESDLSWVWRNGLVAVTLEKLMLSKVYKIILTDIYDFSNIPSGAVIFIN
jgi:hypothetical protein